MSDDTRLQLEPESARRWREDLDSWAIPPEILAAAPETPWGCPSGLFARSTEEALTTGGALTYGGQTSPSVRRALEALPEGGSVLDVGAGAGAASLPLCPPGAAVTAVDQSLDMLAAFAALAGRAGILHREVEGRWPDVAGEVGPVDVVVFQISHRQMDAIPLTRHARRRVVVEITARHPQAGLNPLWEHFHGTPRPTRPTAEDAAGVVRGLGPDVGFERFDAPPRWNGEADRDELVAFTRRRLCLPAERDPEVAALLPPHGPRQHVTLWWDGGA